MDVDYDESESEDKEEDMIREMPPPSKPAEKWQRVSVSAESLDQSK